ncbi:hypothetical protein K2173_013785 [Erythroxylum novogranatense]|uniref:CCHC-type domain-containing protein n=1 Tax=Erythroxylum novogranatense TaxID=1862640 RepID=A0AAV8SCV5_9ROSI|nr:hypothetical protein K2173_013785 [Erythroxylum novogranatense]
MKLRSEFENIRSNLMNQLLREEQRLLTQHTFQPGNTLAFAVQGQGSGRNMSTVQCYSCKEYGHIAKNCKKKFCNYCKQQGHIIKECPTRPPRKISACQAEITPTVHAASTAPAAPTATAGVTPEMVQQMIVSAFSALGLQGKSHLSSQFWLVDSAASNHMTNSSSMLTNVRGYHGSSQIQVANGGSIPISHVGDITPILKNIYVSPNLSTNLISVGQLVDTNCDVHFSRAGCIVQDQVSGKIIAKGPKVGRLFPLHLSIPPVLSFACTHVNNEIAV